MRDPGYSWSIGVFGAVAEFSRDEDEHAAITHNANHIEIVTARGAIRVQQEADLIPVAWDSPLGKTGWSHTLAFCAKRSADMAQSIRVLGRDNEALRRDDRSAILIDCGVAFGLIGFCLRTTDTRLIEALSAAEGQNLLAQPALMAEVLRAQPHRITLSPAGRIEVYQAIPPPDGRSPKGPHTHLLPKILAARRDHAATAPIPNGMQSVLTCHPPPAWTAHRDGGRRYDASADAAFTPLLARYGLLEDLKLEQVFKTTAHLNDLPTPIDRRGRAKLAVLTRRAAMIAPSNTDTETILRLHDRSAERIASHEVSIRRAEGGIELICRFGTSVVELHEPRRKFMREAVRKIIRKAKTIGRAKTESHFACTFAMSDEELAIEAAEKIHMALLKAVRMPLSGKHVEEILNITASERARWGKDGRLKRSGAQKFRRGRQTVQIYTFASSEVERIANNKGIIDAWREADKKADAALSGLSE